MSSLGSSRTRVAVLQLAAVSSFAVLACNNSDAASPASGSGGSVAKPTSPGAMTPNVAAAGTNASARTSPGAGGMGAASGGSRATPAVPGGMAAASGNGVMAAATAGTAAVGGSAAPAVADPSGFQNLAPPMGAPLDPMGKTLTPPAPAGWVYHEIEGTKCRDGSLAGFFLHQGTERKLMIYLEGGGACSNVNLCRFNQSNVNEAFAGDGSTLIGSAAGVVQDRQQPGVFTAVDHQGGPAGVFDLENPMNPFKGWSEVYVPYCTGDIHAGTKTGDVPGLTNQNFHGHFNMKAFMSRLVPTFAGNLDHVILMGASAGSLGTLMNVSMVQDSFGSVHVDAIADAGLPFRDMFWPTCLQKRWRDAWGLNDALPKDCTECFREDGSGIIEYANYLWRKHPKLRVAAISRVEDEIIRLFYSVGLDNCKNYDTLDPVEATVGGILDPATLYPGPMYTAALKDVRDFIVSKGFGLSSFLIGPPNETNLHQIVFRPEFYTLMVKGKTPAQFVGEFLAGMDQQIE